MTRQLYNEIIEYIREIIKETLWYKNVFLVGGCIRDSLLDVDISDIDLFVSFPRGAIRFTSWLKAKDLIFENYQYFKRFGTTKFRFKKYPDLEFDVSFPHHKLECTRGKNYSKEQELQYMTEDCLLRDLTINSLYQHVSTGKILDFSKKGLDDLKNHIIRNTSDPAIIYGENPACMIRVVRFSVKYGWEMSPETRQGLFDHVNLLREGRPSRIHREYGKVLASPGAEAMQQIFQEMGVLDFLEETYQELEALAVEEELRKQRSHETHRLKLEQKQERKRKNLERERQIHEAAVKRKQQDKEFRERDYEGWLASLTPAKREKYLRDKAKRYAKKKARIEAQKERRRKKKAEALA